ncbi:MAG UNVERIFIED_CONTAM: formylglycine-generating enzyme family protein [Anaerolineae bacterium]
MMHEVTNALYGSEGCSDSSSQADQPRNCVDWYDAHAFCEAQGGTLPSEMQWEYAARGVESWEYPWGNDYDAERVIGEDDPTYGDTQTAPVGSRPDGASWVGAMDMSGNIWEWTSAAYRDYPYTQEDEQPNESDISRVLRGGSFNFPANLLRSAFRYLRNPSVNFNDSGFRCAFSLNNSTYNRSMGGYRTRTATQWVRSSRQSRTPALLQERATPIGNRLATCSVMGWSGCWCPWGAS